MDARLNKYGNHDEDSSPAELTSDLLKMCKIIRDKHAKVVPIQRSTGRGGQGPYGSGYIYGVSQTRATSIMSRSPNTGNIYI